MVNFRFIIFFTIFIGSVGYASYWTPSQSEEDKDQAKAQCNDQLVRGLHCSGRYCDNVKLLCGNDMVKGDSYWTPFFSEEGNSEQVCSEGYFVDSLRCKGRYCDSLALRCAKSERELQGSCYWSEQISEENGGTAVFGEGNYVKGIKCSGRYCDNKRVLVCPTSVAQCDDGSCRQRLAEKFSPILRFDQQQGNENKCLPSDAEHYYNARKQGSSERICNTDRNSISTGSIPIYYDFQECGEGTTVIMYWFFYGYQDTCTASAGSHNADWERVAVRIDNGHLSRVQFFQHGGSYTRLQGNFDREGNHPIAFVGKNSHGSYHDSGGTGSCLYFEDFRNPGSIDQKMHTGKNLIALVKDDSGPLWMKDSGTYFDGISAPLARNINLCAMAGCRGNDFSIGNTLCFGQCGCKKSDIGSLPF